VSKTRGFFEAPSVHSVVKMEIVSKFFACWLPIVSSRAEEMCYVDLFSGPGYYDDGTPSTPIRILDKVLGYPDTYKRLRMSFYEGKESYARSLEANVASHEVYKRLQFKPEVIRKDISASILRDLPTDKTSFWFIDPWGYKGISLELLAAVVTSWGSDCLFYLSISGIRRNIDSESKWHDIKAIFGYDGFESLLDARRNGSRTDFNKIVLDCLFQELNKLVRVYMIPFGVEFDRSAFVSHYLVFLSKHHRGFERMVSVMAPLSTVDHCGFPLMLYSPKRDARNTNARFELDDQSENMVKLIRLIRSNFSRRTLTIKETYEEVMKLGFACTAKNTKDVLSYLLSRSELSILDSKTLEPTQKVVNRNIVRYQCDVG